MAEYALKPELESLTAKLMGKVVRFHTAPGDSWNLTEVGIVSKLSTYGDWFGRGSPDTVDRIIIWVTKTHGREEGPYWLFAGHFEIAEAHHADQR